jgi:hypothetical protein
MCVKGTGENMWIEIDDWFGKWEQLFYDKYIIPGL